MLSLSVNADQTKAISEIVVTGNDKTVESIFIQELSFEAGDSPSEQQLAESQQAIMDLGLFETVKFSFSDSSLNIEQTITAQTNAAQTEGQQLLITVIEKRHDWYVLPRINRNGEGDITLGIAWRANNLNGRNQKMKLTLLHKEFEQASKDTEISLDWRYAYPRIAGTPFSASIYANALNVGIDETRGRLAGRYERDQLSTGFRVGRWFADHGQSNGLHIEIGANYTQFKHQHQGGNKGLFFDADVISTVANIEYVDVADRLYSRAGFRTGIEIENASTSLGSDVAYTHSKIYFQRYRPLAYQDHANFNYRVTLASGDHSVFGDPIYELSSGHSIRGIPRETLEGDAFFLVNMEYLTPLFGKEKVRGGLLFDFGNAYDNLGDISELDFEFGYGLALRWQLKSWVNTEIRLDIATGSGDDGETKVYLATDAYF